MSDRDPALPRVRYRTPLRRKVIMGVVFVAALAVLFAFAVLVYAWINPPWVVVS